MTRTQWILSILTVVLCTAGATHAATTAGAKCAVAKIQAASKKAAGKLACYEKALKKGHPVDATCLAKTEEKFTNAFAKAQIKGGAYCTMAGDAASVEGLVDSFVASVVQAEPACDAQSTLCIYGVCCPGLTCVLEGEFYLCK